MKRLLTLVIIAAIALIVWALQNYKEEQDNIATDIVNPHFVDIFMRNFTLTATDKTGTPSYTLQASYFEHYNDKANSQLTEPVINLLQESNRWLITAKTGELDKDNHLIILHDEVVMQQQGITTPIHITTSRMEFNTEKKIATSHQKVYILQKDLKLQSNGMILNNTTSKLELLSNVKGRYVQPD